MNQRAVAQNALKGWLRRRNITPRGDVFTQVKRHGGNAQAVVDHALGKRSNPGRKKSAHKKSVRKKATRKKSVRKKSGRKRRVRRNPKTTLRSSAANIARALNTDAGTAAEIKSALMRNREQGMRVANELLEGYGIEAARDSWGGPWKYDYVNMGDPYVPTVVLWPDDRVWFTDIGEIEE